MYMYIYNSTYIYIFGESRMPSEGLIKCHVINPGFLCAQLTIMFSNSHIIIVIFTLFLELSYEDPKQRGKTRRQCRDQSGEVWLEGQSYTRDCVTYTCSKLGKKLMTMVPSVIGEID